jgi:hypothetical protein
MTRDVRGEIEGNRVELSNQEKEIIPFLLLRASSGHVAAPPSCAMNLRLFISFGSLLAGGQAEPWPCASLNPEKSISLWQDGAALQSFNSVYVGWGSSSTYSSTFSHR